MDASLLNADRYPHGTRARYNSARCRCTACRKANSAYEQSRQKRILDGDTRQLVSSVAARRHLRKLERLGVGSRAVADAAGVSRTIIQGIRRGTRPRCRANIERQILAVDVSAISDGSSVPASKTRRLIAELLDEGFRKYQIAERLGSKAMTPALQLKGDRVLARTELKVRKLHAELLDDVEATEPAPVITKTPRERILRAIRFFDAIRAEHLFESMDLDDDECRTYAKAISRLAESGELYRVLVDGRFEYSLPRQSPSIAEQ